MQGVKVIKAVSTQVAAFEISRLEVIVCAEVIIYLPHKPLMTKLNLRRIQFQVYLSILLTATKSTAQSQCSINLKLKSNFATP